MTPNQGEIISSFRLRSFVRSGGDSGGAKVAGHIMDHGYCSAVRTYMHRLYIGRSDGRTDGRTDGQFRSVLFLPLSIRPCSLSVVRKVINPRTFSRTEIRVATEILYVRDADCLYCIMKIFFRRKYFLLTLK